VVLVVVVVVVVGSPRGCLGAPGTPLPKILKILVRYGGVPRGSLTPPYRVTHNRPRGWLDIEPRSQQRAQYPAAAHDGSATDRSGTHRLYGEMAHGPHWPSVRGGHRPTRPPPLLGQGFKQPEEGVAQARPHDDGAARGRFDVLKFAAVRTLCVGSAAFPILAPQQLPFPFPIWNSLLKTLRPL
jgi:hypothetical protein